MCCSKREIIDRIDATSIFSAFYAQHAFCWSFRNARRAYKIYLLFPRATFYFENPFEARPSTPSSNKKICWADRFCRPPSSTMKSFGWFSIIFQAKHRVPDKGRYQIVFILCRYKTACHCRPTGVSARLNKYCNFKFISALSNAQDSSCTVECIFDYSTWTETWCT